MRPALAFLGLVLGGFASGQSEYPDWFYGTLPEGWAAVFAATPEEAVDAASQVLAAYRSVRVRGNFQQLYDDAIDDGTWQNTDYRFEYEQSRADSLKNSLAADNGFVVDLLNGTRLWLVGPKTQPWKGAVTPSAWADRPKPAWADLWAGVDAGRRFGVGRFTLKGAAPDAWITAESQALFNLLVSDKLKLAHVNQADVSAAGSHTAQMEWIKLDFAVKDLRVDGRWVDPEHLDAVVLISAPAESVTALN